MALFIRRPGLPAAPRQAAIYRARFSPTRPFAILSCCYLFVFSFSFAHLLFFARTLCRVHLLTNIKGCFIPARSCEAGGSGTLSPCLFGHSSTFSFNFTALCVKTCMYLRCSLLLYLGKETRRDYVQPAAVYLGGLSVNAANGSTTWKPLSRDVSWQGPGTSVLVCECHSEHNAARLQH